MYFFYLVSELFEYYLYFYSFIRSCIYTFIHAVHLYIIVFHIIIVIIIICRDQIAEKLPNRTKNAVNSTFIHAVKSTFIHAVNSTFIHAVHLYMQYITIFHIINEYIHTYNTYIHICHDDHHMQGSNSRKTAKPDEKCSEN